MTWRDRRRACRKASARSRRSPSASWFQRTARLAAPDARRRGSAQERRLGRQRSGVRLDQPRRVVDVGQLHDLAGRVHVAERDRRRSRTRSRRRRRTRRRRRSAVALPVSIATVMPSLAAIVEQRVADDRADDRAAEHGRPAAELDVSAPGRGTPVRRPRRSPRSRSRRPARAAAQSRARRRGCSPPARSRRARRPTRAGRRQRVAAPRGRRRCPIRSSSAPERTRPFGSASGGPSSTTGSPGRTSSSACSRSAAPMSTRSTVPRELALLRRDDDAAHLAGRRRDPDALARARRPGSRPRAARP